METRQGSRGQGSNIPVNSSSIDQRSRHDISLDSTLKANIDSFLTRERITYLTNRHESQNLFLDLKISTHNINGLKTDPHKLFHLIEYMMNENIDMMAINETNIDGKTGKFIIHETQKDKVKGYWSNSVSDKIKGSGVALIVNDKWASHYYQHKEYSPYLMVVKFIFRKHCQIWVWIVYAAPSERQTQFSLENTINILSEEFKKHQQDTLHIILGDFNEIIDPELDIWPPQEK